jgi:hypothetical protein
MFPAKTAEYSTRRLNYCALLLNQCYLLAAWKDSGQGAGEECIMDGEKHTATISQTCTTSCTSTVMMISSSDDEDASNNEDVLKHRRPSSKAWAVPLTKRCQVRKTQQVPQ